MRNKGLIGKICNNYPKTENKTRITGFNKHMSKEERDYYGEEFNEKR